MTPMKTSSRKLPQRTCIGCRDVSDKRKLIRIVRTPAGSLALDPKGRAAGRGAYICASPDCWKSCLNSNKLEFSLKVKITPEERSRLLAEGLSLIGGE
jgi:uncharacterized protein